jgi:PAS domain S-box-containing protein
MKEGYKEKYKNLQHLIKRVAPSKGGEKMKVRGLGIEFRVMFFSVFFGLMVWVGDAIIDYYIFYDKPFWNLLIADIPNHEMYIRSFMLLCFLAFGMFVSSILHKFKKTKKKLEEAKEYSENVINSSLDYIVTADQVGYITGVNTFFLKSLGYEREDVIGKHIVEFSPTTEGVYDSITQEQVYIDEQFLKDRKSVMYSLSEKGSIVDWENYLMRADKKLIPVEQNIVNLYDKGGVLTGSLGIIRDITRRKKAEQEVKDSRDFLNKVFDTTADGIIVVDSSAHILKTNNAVTELTGFKQEELIGKHIKELGVKDTTTLDKLEAQIINSICEQGFIKNLELAFLKKDGGLIPLELNASFFINTEGALTGGVAVLRDISERKQAEETLRYRFDLEHLIADISTNFIKLDLDGTDSGINRALQSIGEFLNVDRINVFLFNQNKTVMNITHEWNGEGIASQKENHQELNVSILSGLMDQLTRLEPINIPRVSDSSLNPSFRENSLHWQGVKSFVAVPIVYGQELKGFICFVSIREEKEWMAEDITLLQAVGDVFINALEHKKGEEAKASEQLKSRFLTNITHEFRTPLTLSLAPLEELLMGRNGDIGRAVKEKLKLSFKNIRKLLDLINQLLAFSRLDSGAAVVSYQKKNIKDFVETIVTAFSSLAERKSIEVVFTHDRGDFTAYIDSEKMDKVLVNVIGNAFKFTPEGGKVEVACRSAGVENQMPAQQGDKPDRAKDFLEITVWDNGIGIKAEDREKIFDRFKQTNSAFATEMGGTGLGLSLAKELIELQGGSIAVESVYGQGSMFSIRIPKGRKHIKEEAIIRQDSRQVEVPQNAKEFIDLVEHETDDEDEEVSSDKPLILVADDNQDMRRYIKGVLERDYEVITAKDGLQAWEKIQQFVPSLIIADIMMPGMDGYQLCKILKSSSDFNFIPFIFLTAKTGTEMKIGGLEEGADEYITKPFSALELTARVKSLLRNRELVRENLGKEDLIRTLTAALQEKSGYHNMVGKSTAIREVFKMMESVKNVDLPVLITGETGTGKELIAQSIHYHGKRSDKPLIVQNCSSISEYILESEVFGHVKGAFTDASRDKRGLFDLADGGTLFLDEIGELPLNTQAKFLRVLENKTFYPLGGDTEKQVDIRLITATNRNLRESVKKGTFREDLYYRLNVINIDVPPLRERREDIQLLIEHFLDELQTRYKKKKCFSNQALKGLIDYSYPGNIRELKNIVEKSYLLCLGRSIQHKDLPVEVKGENGKSSKHEESINDMMESAQRLEQKILIEALIKANKNKARAARMLNITKPTLYKRIKEYNIDLDSL